MYKDALRHALIEGHRILQNGGTAMDAAVAAVVSMESEFTFSECYYLSKPKS
jgi:isoaspartyl peptidase/L-asparaginase-like protein (Ntn-hydrolase superfamily)